MANVYQPNPLGMPVAGQPLAQPGYAHPGYAQPGYAQPAPQPYATPAPVAAVPVAQPIYHPTAAMKRFKSLPPEKKKKATICGTICCIICIVVIVLIVALMGNAACNYSCKSTKIEAKYDLFGNLDMSHTIFKNYRDKVYLNTNWPNLNKIKIDQKRGKVYVNPTNIDYYTATSFVGLQMRDSCVMKENEMKKKVLFPTQNSTSNTMTMNYDVSGLGVNDNCFCRSTDIYMTLYGGYSLTPMDLDISSTSDDIILQNGQSFAWGFKFGDVDITANAGAIKVENVNLKANKEIEIEQKVKAISITAALIDAHDISIDGNSILQAPKIDIESQNPRGNIKIDGKLVGSNIQIESQILTKVISGSAGSLITLKNQGWSPFTSSATSAYYGNLEITQSLGGKFEGLKIDGDVSRMLITNTILQPSNFTLDCSSSSNIPNVLMVVKDTTAANKMTWANNVAGTGTIHSKPTSIGDGWQICGSATVPSGLAQKCRDWTSFDKTVTYPVDTTWGCIILDTKLFKASTTKLSFMVIDP
jgi:hypothetical protein